MKDPQRTKQNKQKEAGKKSAAARAPRANVRLHIVALIFDRLDHKLKCRPYSTESIDALHEKYCIVMRRPNDFYWYDPHTLGFVSQESNDMDAVLRLQMCYDFDAVARLQLQFLGEVDPRAFYKLSEDHPFWFLVDHGEALKAAEEKAGVTDLSSLKVPVPPNVVSFLAEFELSSLVKNAMSKLSDEDQKALQQVSRETLKKDLKSLGVRGRSRPPRSG
jgi:hypothetical protein